MGQSTANRSLDRNSLIYRENTGKYIILGIIWCSRGQKPQQAPRLFPNSLQFVTGITFEEQGNFRGHSGTYRTDHGKSLQGEAKPSITTPLPQVGLQNVRPGQLILEPRSTAPSASAPTPQSTPPWTS